jgi:hypothetical protein
MKDRKDLIIPAPEERLTAELGFSPQYFIRITDNGSWQLASVAQPAERVLGKDSI